MIFRKNTKKEAVYSSTDFSDLLSSPIFYSVIALAFILGLSSVFGFFNNPRKLQAVVDVISQRILISPNSNMVSYGSEDDYLLQKYSLKATSIKLDPPALLPSTKDPYHVSSSLTMRDSVTNSNIETQHISFDYDITSKQFWGDFDTSRLESVIEESQRQYRDALMIGAPLSSDFSFEQGDNKYSMRAGILRL